MKQLGFIIHGKMSRQEALKQQAIAVFNKGYQIYFYTTEHKGHAMALTQLAINGGCKELIAVGGDGTLNEVVNGIMTADTIKDNIYLSLFPKGSANDFARTIGVQADLLMLKQSIEKNLYKKVDLGLAAFNDTDHLPCSRYFINITDVGMGGVIAEKTAGASKWMGAYLTFQWAIISTLISYKKQQVNIKTDVDECAGEMMNAIVANGKYFGNGLAIAPDASIDDGKFSMVTIGNISIRDYIKFSGDVRNCRKLNHPEVRYMQASEVCITAPQKPLPIDMDGEFVGYSPLKISIVPAVLNFRI